MRIKRWDPPVTTPKPDAVIELPPIMKNMPEVSPFRCISCFEPAECLFSGRSYCRTCLQKDRATGKVF